MAVAAVVVLAAGLAAGGFVVTGSLNTATPDRAGVEAPSTPSNSPTESPTTTASAGFATHPATTSAQSADTAWSATVGSLTATFMDLPPAPLPETAPGLTEPGILLMAWPASDGSFDVVERIRLVNAVSVLTLRPAPVDRAGRQFTSVSATQVQVRAVDQTVIVSGAEVDAAMDLPVAEVDRFEMRYRLTGVTVRSAPSPTGRALAAIGPLTGGVDDELPVQFMVAGATVLGLNCPLLPLSQQSCGSRGQTGGFERELPWRLALTTVQFNEPPA